ncbi:glutamate--tRNA ligase [Helicobacter turcicus]|uniref:Glutamate--tRNA ligase n=1 Tax=Helicobacter turcicus TaxID=2867412 RepID=A0ABS7JNL4_9HELI|nr:glutamate--tRNA ligase [Helicobacter turcicus]MBX7491006.1 glutamate--tRNA ligase [Helicobacter turcicus]MBX7545867.1 glutamate--tRNA ligase [Helicobacter turcicus]
MNNIVTRFAPSPTGYLHIGGLRTALFNYLYARANGGKFLLRIEDTDLARNSIDAKDAILQAFNWVGMDYDGEVVYQSQRFALYAKYVERLLKEGKAYYCYMQKEELEANRKEAEAKGKVWHYDRRYRDFIGTPPEGVKPVVRIKAPLEGEVYFKDGIKGEMRICAKELDDFIIARSDGVPTYNFVVAIDDALMGITDVIRGDDHLSNTPKQIVVYEALGFPVPRFFHVPMILNPEGKKLSKRDGAMSVMEYKALGYLPQALLNFLVRLGWSHGDTEIFSMREMLELFNPNNLNSAPSSYNAEKLLWLNAHYLNALNAESINAILPFYGASVPSVVVQEVLYPEIKERSKTLVEFVEILKKCLNPVESFDKKMLQKVKTDENIHFFNAFIVYLNTLKKPFQSAQDVEVEIATFADFHGLKAKNLFMPLRYALLGSSGGVGISSLIAALGINETKERILKALESLRYAKSIGNETDSK